MARGSGERSPRIIEIVTGKNVRYVAITTTDGQAAAEREHDHRRECHDRDRLAGHDVRDERTLEQSEVDEERREQQPEQRPDDEPQRRLAPRVERRADQELEQ